MRTIVFLHDKPKLAG